MKEEQEQFFTVEEVTEILGASASEINHWISSGQIKLSERPGHEWRVSEKQLRKFIDDAGLFIERPYSEKDEEFLHQFSEALDRTQKARHEGFRAGLSLAAAIQEAGGSVSSIAKKLQAGMTVEDFVTTVAAQNGIGFKFEKSEEGITRWGTKEKERLGPQAEVTAIQANEFEAAIESARLEGIEEAAQLLEEWSPGCAIGTWNAADKVRRELLGKEEE